MYVDVQHCVRCICDMMCVLDCRLWKPCTLCVVCVMCIDGLCCVWCSQIQTVVTIISLLAYIPESYVDQEYEHGAAYLCIQLSTTFQILAIHQHTLSLARAEAVNVHW